MWQLNELLVLNWNWVSGNDHDEQRKVKARAHWYALLDTGRYNLAPSHSKDYCNKCAPWKARAWCNNLSSLFPSCTVIQTIQSVCKVRTDSTLWLSTSISGSNLWLAGFLVLIVHYSFVKASKISLVLLQKKEKNSTLFSISVILDCIRMKSRKWSCLPLFSILFHDYLILLLWNSPIIMLCCYLL